MGFLKYIYKIDKSLLKCKRIQNSPTNLTRITELEDVLSSGSISTKRKLKQGAAAQAGFELVTLLP